MANNLGNLFRPISGKKKKIHWTAETGGESPQSQINPEQKVEIKEAVKFRPNLRQELEPIYSKEQKEVKKLIEQLQEEIRSLAKGLEEKKKAKKFEKLGQETIVKPGKYHLNYFLEVKRWILQAIVDVRKASTWLEALTVKQRKRGAFWQNFTRKRGGGAQYRLSGEHSAARAAA